MIQNVEADAANGFGSCVCAFKNVGTERVLVRLDAVALCLKGASLVGDV